MYADLFDTNLYDIEELPRFKKMPCILKIVNQIYFNDRLNRHIRIPLKDIWNNQYALTDYKFDPEEQYWIIFLNGTIRNYYTYNYLKKLKREHSNIKLAMVMYDSFSNQSNARAVSFIPLFDAVLSFDKGDCEKYGLISINSTFSFPKFVKKDDSYSSSVFFVGSGDARLKLMQEVFHAIASKISNSKFFLIGVRKKIQKYNEDIIYSKPIDYKTSLMYSYNTNCIIEILKPGQTGISLRTCEAILFNKKLLTNNLAIRKMPFYNEKYMRVFSDEKSIDWDFIKSSIDVEYNYSGYFSPLQVIERLSEIS